MTLHVWLARVMGCTRLKVSVRPDIMAWHVEAFKKRL